LPQVEVMGISQFKHITNHQNVKRGVKKEFLSNF